MISLLLLLAFDSTSDQSLTVSWVSQEELTISAIEVYSSVEKVLALLGEPLAHDVDTASIETYVTLTYEGLTLYLDDNGLYEISAKSKKYCTPAGICPGSSREELERAYGQPMKVERPHGNFLEYVVQDYPCYLQLAMHGGVVETVRVECAP